MPCISFNTLKGHKKRKKVTQFEHFAGGYRSGKDGQEKRLWVFFLNDKNRIQYNDQCKKCVYECKQSFRCRIVWCGKYYSKRTKQQIGIRMKNN